MSRDLYAEVTDKIIAQLEAGTAPWVRPWTADPLADGFMRPYNAITRKPYRGINTLLLSAGGWMTYKQAASVGAHVRKGEHGSLIVFYKPLIVKDRSKPVAADGTQAERSIPLLRAFTVFHTSQIDDLPAQYLPQPDTRTEPQRIACAEALFAQARHYEQGNKAFYSSDLDVIYTPPLASFNSAPDFYATALHELTHWTGHRTRLDREYGKRFGDTAYAREELVAEMGAAFLCAHCGIEGRLQHPAYIASWLAVLKEDKRAVLVAASAAQKAADFVIEHGSVPEPDENTEIVEPEYLPAEASPAQPNPANLAMGHGRDNPNRADRNHITH